MKTEKKEINRAKNCRSNKIDRLNLVEKLLVQNLIKNYLLMQLILHILKKFKINTFT